MQGFPAYFNMKKQVSFNSLSMEKGDSLFIEKLDNMTISQTEITLISTNSIEFFAPRYETGATINFKPGEAVNVYYWSADGNKYSFQSIIQNARTMNNTHSILLPTVVNHDAVRRWTRYKPMNMITSFINKTSSNKLNEAVHVARIINISAGGMLISTPKRINIEDELGVGFYIRDTFFTALGVVKSSSSSRINIGEMDVALQFVNYSEKDKEYLDSILSSL